MLISEVRDRVLIEAGALYMADLSLLGVPPAIFLTVVRQALDYWTGFSYDHRTIICQPDFNGVIDLNDYVDNGQLSRLPIMVSDVLGNLNHNRFDTSTKVYQWDPPKLKLLTAFAQSVRVTCEVEWTMTQVGLNDKSISTQPASPGSTSVPRLGGWNPNEIYTTPSPRDIAPSAPEDELAKWEIKNLEKSEKVTDFINLAAAKFMIALGRGRRAFMLNELPVQLDGDALVSEGQLLWETTVARIEETSDIFMLLLETPRTSGVW
jgi:hypothetical protein